MTVVAGVAGVAAGQVAMMVDGAVMIVGAGGQLLGATGWGFSGGERQCGPPVGRGLGGIPLVGRSSRLGRLGGLVVAEHEFFPAPKVFVAVFEMEANERCDHQADDDESEH